MGTARGGFSTGEAVRITGVSFRNIDYWARTKFIVPSIAEAQGTGTEQQSLPTSIAKTPPLTCGPDCAAEVAALLKTL